MAGFGALEVEQLGRYVEEHVIARLEAGDIAGRSPPDESWEYFEFRPYVWDGVAAQRGQVAGELDAIVRSLLARGEGAEPGIEAAAAPLLGESVLRADGLTKVYRRRKVVNEVQIQVQQGEIVGLLGPNGAGKTTTFYMIVGLISPNQGRVYLDGAELTDVPMYRRARLGIGYLAQEPSVFRKLTVEQNVLAILETLSLARKERAQRLEELLSELSLAHLRTHRAYSLSGGERRRLEITRALVRSPKFMLLDEPFAGIDPIAVNDIQQIVKGLRGRQIGVIITYHNVEQTLDIV
ncbi:MAG: LPS export ABC transporter ATP-binding protein, partial [Gemmatimonadetes bacterium]|nr:LPS export ABC transporter ATP-binding protein [Gemmatimonadota bacterium]